MSLTVVDQGGHTGVMPTDTEVVERHRAEMRAARAKMTNPYSDESTAIFAALTEQHRLEWVERVSGVKAEEAAERRAEERAARVETTTTPAPAKVTPAKSENLCEGCGSVIPPTGKKGRPAKRCTACKASEGAPAPAEAAPAKVSQRVTILGPNLMIRDTTTFHVHAAGCADMKKRQYRGVMSGGEHWTSDFSSLQDIVESTYDGQMSDNADDPEWGKWEAYESEFTFFPCVTLPREA